MRVNRRGFDQLASRIDHRHLHPGANARVQPHHHARAGGRGQQQITQVVGKHLDGDFFGVFAQAGEQVALQRQAQLDAPGPGDAFAQQVVSGPGLVAPAQVQRDFSFRNARLACDRGHRQHQFGIQNLQPPTAKNSQCPVRRHAANRLVVVKIIAKLGVVGVVFIFACDEF